MCNNNCTIYNGSLYVYRVCHAWTVSQGLSRHIAIGRPLHLLLEGLWTVGSIIGILAIAYNVISTVAEQYIAMPFVDMDSE